MLHFDYLQFDVVTVSVSLLLLFALRLFTIELSVGLSGSLTRRLKFPKNLRQGVTAALSSEFSTFTDLRYSITIGIM